MAALQLKYGRPTVVCVNWIKPVTYVTLKCYTQMYVSHNQTHLRIVCLRCQYKATILPTQPLDVNEMSHM